MGQELTRKWQALADKKITATGLLLALTLRLRNGAGSGLAPDGGGKTPAAAGLSPSPGSPSPAETQGSCLRMQLFLAVLRPLPLWFSSYLLH